MAPSMDVDLSSTPLSSPRLEPHSGPPVVLCTAHDESGTLLVTAHSCSTLRLWTLSSANDWAAEQEFSTGHAPGSITSLAFAPARLGAVVVTSGSDGLAAVHALSGAGRTQLLKDALGALFHVAFSARGALATLGEERVARIYERAPGGQFRLLRALDCAVAIGGAVAIASTGAVGGLAFRPGGDALAAGGRVFARENNGGWKDVRGPGVRGARCAHWGAKFLAVGCEDGSVTLCAAAPGGMDAVERLADGEPAPVVQLDWDPAGAVVAAVHGDGVVRTWGRRPQSAEEGEQSGVWAWCLRDTVKVAEESG